MQIKPKIKFCGITRFEDASFAIELGVDALGFNFYEKSPRFVSIAQAQTIVRKLVKKTSMVGVFVNHTEKQVLEIARRVPLDGLQFHGDEAPEFCEKFRDEWLVLKALRLKEGTKRQDLEAYQSACDHLLFDRYEAFLFGGSGKEISDSLLSSEFLKDFLPSSYLSGGLKPDNVAGKCALYRPYGLDVASGIESSPGVKDRALMARFVEQAMIFPP